MVYTFTADSHHYFTQGSTQCHFHAFTCVNKEVTHESLQRETDSYQRNDINHLLWCNTNQRV